MSQSHYFWPGQVLIGPEVVEKTGPMAGELAAKHVFIVADPGILRLLEPVTASLDAAGIAHTTFSKVVGNPEVTHVDAAAAAYRASGADTIIGFGGGSALDMAKGVRVLAAVAETDSAADYMGSNPNMKPMPSVRHMPPMIAIPTTAGTGSEVTPWGVVTNKKTNQKAGIGGVRLIPNVAIVDPTLTVGLPPFLTAATGMDALSHLIEAYVSTYAQPALDSLILRGIELVGKNLQVAVEEPTNLIARQNMLEASTLGGIAISSNYLGAAHSLAHQLSTFADMHHGLACAMMLPPQMSDAMSAAADRYADIQAALHIDGASDAAEAVHLLNERVGLPTRLSDAKVTEDMLDPMAKHAFKDSNWSTNPKPMTEEDMLRCYKAIF